MNSVRDGQPVSIEDVQVGFCCARSRGRCADIGRRLGVTHADAPQHDRQPPRISRRDRRARLSLDSRRRPQDGQMLADIGASMDEIGVLDLQLPADPADLIVFADDH